MSPVQTMLLGVIVAGFATFMITLFAVSLYVSAGRREDEPAVPRVVTPARRVD
ncbi:MAG TPA: hypothetical protein VFE13_06775 [Caulobacteraceae bacterium]|jgi:hypothetical protein|nr:hypothetical protein [Caulobacteraceae bacterium]